MEEVPSYRDVDDAVQFIFYYIKFCSDSEDLEYASIHFFASTTPMLCELFTYMGADHDISVGQCQHGTCFSVKIFLS